VPSRACGGKGSWPVTKRQATTLRNALMSVGFTLRSHGQRVRGITSTHLELNGLSVVFTTTNGRTFDVHTHWPQGRGPRKGTT
jgi:hypothetical protein